MSMCERWERRASERGERGEEQVSGDRGERRHERVQRGVSQTEDRGNMIRNQTERGGLKHAHNYIWPAMYLVVH